MMKKDTKRAADLAAKHLDSLLERAERDTAAAVERSDIPITVAYFAELRGLVRILAERTSALQKHIDTLSYDLIPTMFGNQDVKSIKVDDVGTVSIIDRWTASMLNKERALAWLRSTGNEGMIIETVSASTLGAFGKEETIAGRPLPSDIFRVTAAPHVSIRQS